MRHHRSDALSAVALVGIGGSLGWRVLDPLAGLVVAAMVAAMEQYRRRRVAAHRHRRLPAGAARHQIRREGRRRRARLEVRNRGMGGTALVDLAIQVDPPLRVRRTRWPRRCGTPSSTTATTSPRFRCTSTSRCTRRPCVRPPLGAHPRRRRGAGARRPPQLEPEVVEVPRVVVHYQETGGITDAQLRVADADAAPLGDLRKVASRARRRLLDARPTSRTCRSRSSWTTSTRRRRRTHKTAPVAA